MLKKEYRAAGSYRKFVQSSVWKKAQHYRYRGVIFFCLAAGLRVSLWASRGLVEKLIIERDCSFHTFTIGQKYQLDKDYFVVSSKYQETSIGWKVHSGLLGAFQ